MGTNILETYIASIFRAAVHIFSKRVLSNYAFYIDSDGPKLKLNLPNNFWYIHSVSHFMKGSCAVPDMKYADGKYDLPSMHSVDVFCRENIKSKISY